MKKSILFIAIFAITLMSSTQIAGQAFKDLDKSPMDAAAYPSSYKESDKIVKVVYSRPQLKGREVAKLAPAGKVWRTGANEAAEITFYRDVTFGGKAVTSKSNISVKGNYQYCKKCLGIVFLQRRPRCSSCFRSRS